MAGIYGKSFSPTSDGTTFLRSVGSQLSHLVGSLVCSWLFWSAKLPWLFWSAGQPWFANTMVFVGYIISRIGCLQLGLLLVAAVFQVVIALLVGPLDQPIFNQLTVIGSLLSLVHRDKQTIMNPYCLLNHEAITNIHQPFNCFKH